MQSYYRIVSSYLGEQTEFIPKYSYEQIEFENGVYRLIENRKEKIKEVCFAKTVVGCLFAINMFLKEGEYFIYQTTEAPSIDLSISGIGDFPTIGEVRYREKVESNYFGKIDVSPYLIHCLQSTYDMCCYGEDKFDYEWAKKELIHFKTVNNEIVLA